MGKTYPGTVKDTGATAESLLVGDREHNQGLRVRVHEYQPSGDGGRIIGSFTIIDAGSGYYSNAFQKFVGKKISSVNEILELLHQEGAESCTHAFNRNCLRLFESQTEEESSNDNDSQEITPRQSTSGCFGILIFLAMGILLIIRTFD